MHRARRASTNRGCLAAAAINLKHGKTLRAFLSILAAAALLTSAGRSHAADLALPPVNLGDTNFQDAIAFPGWLVEELFTYYHADQFNDYQGKERPGSNEVTVATAVTHVAWISNYKLFGGFYGAEILVPLAHIDIKTEFGPNDQDAAWGTCP